MDRFSTSITTIKTVLSKRNYFFLFFFSSLISFFVFYFLTLWTVTNKSLRIFIEMNGYNYVFFSFLFMAVISLLLGIFISLFVFKIRIRKSYGVFGFLGLITGVFSSGCPMCGSIIFALFGMPLALFLMPFKGLELRVLSIILLTISIYSLSKNLNSCKITPQKTN